MSDQFYIVDLRTTFTKNPYVTLWRPDSKGYCYPIPWAGVYTMDEIKAHPSYYSIRRWMLSTESETGPWDRFPVPVDSISTMLSQPKPGVVDGDVGPVIINNLIHRTALRRRRLVLDIPKPPKLVQSNG